MEKQDLTGAKSKTAQATTDVRRKAPGPWIIGLCIGLFALLLTQRIFLFQPFTIPSGAMQPTLAPGDYVIVSKFAYGLSRYSFPGGPPIMNGRVFAKPPSRGDIVVFKLPPQNKVDYIKRVIGIPGDRIRLTDGIVYVNDKPLPQELLPQKTADAYGDVKQALETNPIGKKYVIQDMGPDGAYDTTDVYVVPPGHYFTLGDNRDNSSDSRVPQEMGGVGFVPEENLIGRAEMVLFSQTEPGRRFLRLN